MKFYATRDAAQSSGVWRDEDIAMAHQTWGPFPTAEEADKELAFRMREEAAYLDLHAAGDSARQRSAEILAAADKIYDGSGREEAAGLLWQITVRSHR